MRAPRKFKPVRAGFTLVEILVVIGIISILVALLAAGIFQVIVSQRQSNTENSMRAVYKILARQMKAVLDKADTEDIPDNVTNNLAGGDSKLARIIWKKLRLKQEFPMTFAEALAPYNPFAANPPGTAAPAPYPLVLTDLKPLPAYTKALQNLGSVNWQGQPFVESSICLLLALQQNRGGVSLTPDQLGSAAVAIQIKNPSLPAATAQKLTNSGLKMLVDSWGVEMAFFRFPTSNDDISSTGISLPLNSELDNLNPAAAGSTQATYRDPYDPQGLLVNPTWNSYTNWSSGSQGVYWFEQYCHLVHAPSVTVPATAANYKPWARYMQPTLVSAGRNGKWGLNNMFSTSYSNYYMNGVNPDMSIEPIQTSVDDSNDNIYSYRLGLDTRGD